MKNYKYISFILAGVMGISLVSCGKDEPAESSESSAESSVTEVTETTESETETEGTSAETEKYSENKDNESVNSSATDSEGGCVVEDDYIVDDYIDEYDYYSEINSEIDEAKKNIIYTLINSYADGTPELIDELFYQPEIDSVVNYAKEVIEDFDENEWNEKMNRDSVKAAYKLASADFNEELTEWEEDENIELIWTEYYFLDDADYLDEYFESIGFMPTSFCSLEAGIYDEETGISIEAGDEHVIFEIDGQWYLSYAGEIDSLTWGGYIDYEF